MASQTQTSPKPDTAKNSVRSRFQFSLRTLLWVITACAVASAVLGWIGPEWGLAFLFGLPHMALWGVPVIWLSLRSLRKHIESGFFAGAILSVMWTGPLYVVVISGIGFGTDAMQLARITTQNKLFGTAAGDVVFFEFTLPFVLFFAAIAAAIAAAALSVFVSLVLKPWGSRPLVFASLVGGGVGAFLPPLFGARFSINTSREELFAYLLLPTAMGLIVPPILSAWANRLGPRVRGGSVGDERSAVACLPRKSEPDA